MCVKNKGRECSVEFGECSVSDVISFVRELVK